MNLKRVIAGVCVAGILGTMFASCGKKGGEVERPQTKTSEVATANNFEKKLEFTIDLLDTDKEEKDPRNAFLMEKFNVGIKYLPVTLNDAGQKVRIWAAAGDMPDVMWFDFKLGGGTIDSAVFLSEYRNWAQSGLLKEIPELSKKYPNLDATRKELKSEKYTQVDGKSYVWLSNTGFSKYHNLSMQGFFYRKDWAEKLGMAKPNDEYTWDEMRNLAKEFISKDPGGNGTGKTIGMASVGWAFPAFVGLQQMSPDWQGYIYKDGKWVWGASQPETLAGLKLAKQLKEEGILWSEQSIAKNLDGPNKYKVGQVGILYHNMNSVNMIDIISNLKKTYPDIDIDKAVAPMYVKSPQNGKFQGVAVYDYYGACAFNSKLSDEKLDRWLTMWNWMVSEEGKNLRRYGLPGKDWNLKDGKIELTWNKDANGKYSNPYESLPGRLLGTVTYDEAFVFESPVIDKQVRETSKKFIDKISGKDGYNKQPDYDLEAFSAPSKDKYGNFAETRDKAIQFILTSKDIEGDWKKFTDSMAPKVNLVLDELNKGLKR